MLPAVHVGAFARNQSGRPVSEKGGRGTDIIDADQALGSCLDPRRIKQGPKSGIPDLARATSVPGRLHAPECLWDRTQSGELVCSSGNR